MQNGRFLAAILGLMWITTLACTGTGANPVQPPPPPPAAPPVEQLPIARPSQPAADARSLAQGVTVEEDLSQGRVLASCPKTTEGQLLLPCRHFNFVAPATGVLRVSATWDPMVTELVVLNVGEIDSDYLLVLPKVLRARVTAGENYRITAALWPSHLDFLGWLAGPFQLTATIE